MIPPDKSHVKILLRNNTIVEGIVQEWYGNVVKLQSLDDKSYVIIPHPEEDIILIKVLLEEVSEENAEETEPEPPAPEAVQTELEEQFQKVYEQPSGDPLREKNLAELKTMMAAQERQIIADKLKSHHLGETKKVKYGYPGFFKKPGSQ
jgi:DNA-binding NtrC family response regulator